MTYTDIISKLKAIKPMLQEQYGVSEIALFGSYARNEQNDNSDIDLMVDFKNKTAKNYFATIYALENYFADKKVQVVSKGGIKENYFKFIQQDLIYA